MTLWLRDLIPASMFPQESYQLIIDFSSASGHIYEFSILMNSILKERDWIRHSERDRKITYHYNYKTNPVDLAKEVNKIRIEVLTAITDLHETNTIADLIYGYMGFQVSLWFGNYISSPFSIYISRVI